MSDNLYRRLRQHEPGHVNSADAIDEIVDLANVVQNALQSLTNTQTQTMVSYPSVLLAHTIANEWRIAQQLDVAIDGKRYQCWTADFGSRPDQPSR